MDYILEGQLPNSIGPLYTTYSGSGQSQLGIVCYNTSATNAEKAVIQQLRVKNGNIKTLVSTTLGPGETFVLQGFTIGGSGVSVVGGGQQFPPGDTIQGSATDANTIDFILYHEGSTVGWTIEAYDANGALKVHPSYTMCCK